MRVFLRTAGLTFAVYSTVGLAFGNIARLGKVVTVSLSAAAIVITVGLVIRAFRRGRLPAGKVLAGIATGILATGLVWNTLGLIALHRAEAAAREVGMTTDHPAFNPHDAGNAAPLYLAMNDAPSLADGARRSKDTQTLKDFLAKAQSGGLKPADERAAGEIIARHADALALARRAADLPRADWPIAWDFDPSWERPTPQHYGTVFAGLALSARAVLESRHGNGREAVETLRQGFLMTRALSQEGLLIGSLCEVLVDQSLLQAANIIMPRVPLALAQARWSELLNPEPMEKGYWVALKQELLADPMHFSRLRWWDISFGKYRGERRDYFVIVPYYWPFIKFDIASAIHSNIILLKAMREDLPLRKDEYDRSFWTALNERWLIGYHALPDYSRLRGSELAGEARLRVASAALEALRYRKAHGRWPASAEELAGSNAPARDPFSSGSLRFAARGKNLLVYSVGPDGHDGGPRTGDLAWQLQP